jgi:hypothetical protein
MKFVWNEWRYNKIGRFRPKTLLNEFRSWMPCRAWEMLTILGIHGKDL